MLELNPNLTVQEVYETASSCSDHPLQFDKSMLDGATTIIAMASDDVGWSDSESFAVGLLTDGRYFIVEEAADSSGHG